MMRQHQFIHKNEQSKNRRRFILLLLLFSACNKGLGSAHTAFVKTNAMLALLLKYKFSVKDNTHTACAFL